MSGVRLALAAAAAVLAAGCGGAAAGGSGGLTSGTGPEEPVLGPGPVTLRLDIEHSVFEPRTVRVAEGSEVRFVLDNGDPIGHELIVGPPAVHERHESGTHAAHGAVPGEVSVGPNAEAETTYRFDEPGTVEFACHLRGHYAHGMHGIVEVVPAD